MNGWVKAAWMACAFGAGWLLREPLSPALPLQVEQLIQVSVDDGGWPDEPYRPDPLVEQGLEYALYSEGDRLQRHLASLMPGTPGQPELYFLGVAGDGTQRVFGREVDFVHQQLQQRYDLDGRSLLLINDRSRIGEVAMATRHSIESALQALGRAMNAEDVLLLYFTSHGGENHDLMLDQEGMLLPDLSAQMLQQLLAQAGIRWQVVIVSACFSGGVIPLLQDADRLIMTSAAADRSSFGCTDDAELTYFGRALFANAFPRHVEWPAMFETAAAWIEQKEREEGMEPSQPQLQVGDGILPQLARIPLRVDHHD